MQQQETWKHHGLNFEVRTVRIVHYKLMIHNTCTLRTPGWTELIEDPKE